MEMPTQDDQRGFTLIELMVVVLILGILIAIALPTFLGARTRAQDSAAKAILKNGLTGAKAYFTKGGTYDGFDVTQAQAEEVGVRWAPNGPPASLTIQINLAEGDYLVLTAGAQNGNTFCILDYQGGAPGIPTQVRGSVNGQDAQISDLKCLAGTW